MRYVGLKRDAMKNSGMTTQMPEEFVRKAPRLEASETGRLGREIYRRDIRDKVEPEHIGEFVAIDVDSGCWALGESIDEARDRLDRVCPEAVDVLLEKIGYNAVGSIGGGAPRRTNWLKE